MKVRAFLFTIIVLFSMVSVGQEIMEQEDIFVKNLNSVFQNPEQTNRVANYLFENAISNSEKAKALYLLSKSKMLQGNTAEAIEDLFKAKEILRNDESPFISCLILIELSERCRYAGMRDIASSYFEQAENLIEKINSKRETAIARTMFLNQQAIIYLNENHVKATLKNYNELENNANNEIPSVKAIIPTSIGHYYLNTHKIDSSEVYFRKSISLMKNSEFYNPSLEASSLAGLGNVYMMKDDLNNSLQSFNDALKVPLIHNLSKINVLESLAHLYKLTDSIELSQKYYNEKATLNTKILNSERNVRSVIIKHIDAEQQNNLLNDKKDYYKWGAWLAALFLLIFIGYYFYNRKLNLEYKRFQKVLAQVEKDEKLQAPFSIDDTALKPSKGIIIPEETERIILERLEEFENSTKFTNSNMNLSLLAKQMKTNSKYISEIIHNHKQKNFNTYINELRVNYIIHLMKTDKAYLNYKVSYLAETSGFSSHSAFTVVFKSITGFTPKQFITFLKKSKKEKSATF